MKNRRYGRKNTNIVVSIFYEQFQLKKYNFEAPYQRDKNVWDSEQKSFLIDTIMKNFPIPPIFLEQKIDTSTGKTSFDVIDGKQRLLTIVDFIENRVKLPETFGNDGYGSDLMNGKSFEELKLIAKKNEEILGYISDFWGYVLNIEYIENPDVKVVDNIFDRLNRGGERLNPQELRKANFYDTIMYQSIEGLRTDEFLSELLSKLNKNRLEDVSFITEIFLLFITGKVMDGNDTQIDSDFKDIVDEVDEDKSAEIIESITAVKDIVRNFNLDYDEYRIRGVSHLYALWYLAFYIHKNGISFEEQEILQLKHFFEELRSENRKNENVVEYHKSMQSASKSRYSRRKRVAALLNYFELPFDIKDI